MIAKQSRESSKPKQRREMINDTKTGHNRSVNRAGNASTASLFGDENAAGVSM
jgi:hypothetical protein